MTTMPARGADASATASDGDWRSRLVSAAGRLRLDVAVVQVTPAREEQVSLGVSVDATPAAIESAGLVIAEVNPGKAAGDSPWHAS